MKCPHCLENFNDRQAWWSVTIGNDKEGGWLLTRRYCPTCEHNIFELETGPHFLPNNNNSQGCVNYRFANMPMRTTRVWPKGSGRPPTPPEVPPQIAEDYNEACLVLADSPKASAALSRRCLQSVLRHAASVKPGRLVDEIEQVIATKTLPPATAENLHAARLIGNFAAHESKNITTGEIVDVEPHEAEWNLEVLESMFNFYYVQPARDKSKRDAILAKLAETKK